MNNIKTIIRKIMNKNTITEELVRAELKKLGYFTPASTYTNTHIDNKVCEEFGVRITDEWSPDVKWYIYEETTRDGYTVYVSTYNPNAININEDIYYYDSDMAGCVIEAFHSSMSPCNGSKRSISDVYISDPDEYYVREAMDQMYTLLKLQARKLIINNLIEQGYVRE